MSFASDPSVLADVAQRALLEVPPKGRTGAVRIGLGTGRAAEAFIAQLADLVRAGLEVVGVPTSERSERLAREYGVNVGSLGEAPLDLAFDGADEVDPRGMLTKGLGGAMLRERIVASEAERFIVLVTEDKLVERLGSRSPLPVEVVPFALETAKRRLEPYCHRVERRTTKGEGKAGPFVTDNGNLVLDLYAERSWDDPEALDAAVRRVPGVVDTGFFFGMASLVVVGGREGIRTIEPVR